MADPVSEPGRVRARSGDTTEGRPGVAWLKPDSLIW
ncbi:hypothetical protein KKC1_10150 [Calderihabitans maritimus]|uniref:Uncharacterized protein n=1 Tax=Calderihabitans maritimus TaxID=1246530 RepID=A0A1Z5HQR8_9FIRM|nr:hypothetical protein KKC1_10150 [Calderihabitans maritimus]